MIYIEKTYYRTSFDKEGRYYHKDDRYWTEWETEDVDDLSQIMTNNQFIQRGKKSDAERIIEVLGTANASFEEVIWKRKEEQEKPYKDFIITIK